MNKGEKMKSPTKDDIREQKVTWKNKCKQESDRANKMEAELEELKGELTGAQIQNNLCTEENDALKKLLREDAIYSAIRHEWKVGDLGYDLWQMYSKAILTK